MVRAAMMPGIAQAKLESIDEGAARQTDAAHQPVEEKRGAGQIGPDSSRTRMKK